MNKFLQSICNCSDYCMTLKFNCSLDDAIATVVVTIREKQPPLLKMQVESTLREREVQASFNNQNYSIFCAETLCEPTTPTTTMDKPTMMVNVNSTNSESVTDHNNIIISAITIAIIAAIALMLLVFIVLLLIILRLCNKQKSKSASKEKINFQATYNTGSECPPTSSNRCTYRSPFSQIVVDPLSSHTIKPTDTSNTDLPNGNATINSSVSSSINPSSCKHSKHIVMKTNQMNSTSNPFRNIQSASEQHDDIRWEQNKTYAILNPHQSANVCRCTPATVPSVTGEGGANFYDDVIGINESRQRVAATSHMHYNKKNTQPKPPQ